MTPPLWVVVPFARRENLSRVVANFARQSYAPKRLCVVENGPAVGACVEAGVKPDLVIRSEAHQADAKNAGNRAVLAHEPSALVAYFDDDDYYGRAHLEELAEVVVRGHAEAAGRLPGFMRLASGLHRFAVPGECSFVRWVQGATLVTWARSSALFPRVAHDDTEWLKLMMARGARIWAGESRQFVYDRSTSTDHVWKTSDILIRRAFGASCFFGLDADDSICELVAPAGIDVPRPSDAEVLAELRRWRSAA